MRTLIVALVFSVLGLFAVGLAPAPAKTPINNKPVLLVVSGNGVHGAAERPGFEMDELTQTYLVLADNGLKVSIASPAGGAVTADKFDPAKPYNARFLADPQASAKLANTTPLAATSGQHYAAVVVIGGKGAMFDLPRDTRLQTLLARTYAEGGIVAALCHGPAALVNLRLPNGAPLVQGRRLTAFSAEEDGLFESKWKGQFPFRLEPELRRLGAVFGKAPMMLPHVEVDGRLVTGQNPYSAARTAEAVVRTLGGQPAAREPWADERSVELVARVLKGDRDWARAELAQRPKLYDMPLIAIWGYYRGIEAGTDNAKLTEALTVMKLAEPHFADPQLQIALAEVEIRLDENQQARKRLEALLAAHPDLADAKSMLARIAP